MPPPQTQYNGSMFSTCFVAVAISNLVPVTVGNPKPGGGHCQEEEAAF